ncbi:uncharacterized protein [Euwallacea fornicatus]|uniref:uncharacterized protein n=1 Tax=Euwallacea fornicatus TaxID=995702 RepID=UPI00338D88EA
MVLGHLSPEVLNYFIAYLQFWGILPHDNFHKNKAMLVKNLMLMCSITFALIFSYYLTVITFYPHITTMHIAADVVKFIFNISVPLTFLLHLMGGNTKWLKILDYLNEVKGVAHFYAGEIRQLILYTNFVTASLILYVSQSSKENTATSFFMKLPVVSLYYESLCAVSICLVNKAITNQLLTIKIILHKLHKYQLNSLSSIKDIKRHYLGAVERTMILDTYFGGKILVNFGNSTTRLLGIFISSIHYWNPEKFVTTLDVEWEQFSRALIVAVYGMIPAFIITTSCGKVTKSTDCLISSCYRLQYKFPYGSYEQRELNSLWKYISENKLVYTGMGFYQIQPSVLLGIIASSTTYFIALIQFNG